MARKSKYSSEERGAELSEMLDALESLLERTKVLYEQYFMGIQKIAPAQLHKDIERKIRELTQEQIRNTALRFRLTTLTQKFGSYSTYWNRTMRAIEQGRYVRDLARVKRKADRRGEDIPDELVAAMPKRIRDRIRRDRERLAERTERAPTDDEAMIVDAPPNDADDWELDQVLDGLDRKPAPRQQQQVYRIDEDDDILGDRIDELFAALTHEAEEAVSRPAASARSAPGRRRIQRPTAEAPMLPPQNLQPRLAADSSGAAGMARGTRLHPAARAAGADQDGLPPPPGMTEAQTRNLYEQYRQARQAVGAGDVSYERLKRTLHEQTPRLMRQYNAQGLEYDVVVKDDKVVLKATPKRG